MDVIISFFLAMGLISHPDGKFLAAHELAIKSIVLNKTVDIILLEKKYKGVSPEVAKLAKSIVAGEIQEEYMKPIKLPPTSKIVGSATISININCEPKDSKQCLKNFSSSCGYMAKKYGYHLTVLSQYPDHFFSFIELNTVCPDFIVHNIFFDFSEKKFAVIYGDFSAFISANEMFGFKYCKLENGMNVFLINKDSVVICKDQDPNLCLKKLNPQADKTTNDIHSAVKINYKHMAVFNDFSFTSREKSNVIRLKCGQISKADRLYEDDTLILSYPDFIDILIASYINSVDLIQHQSKRQRNLKQ